MTTLCASDMDTAVYFKAVLVDPRGKGTWDRVPVVVHNPPTDPRDLRMALARAERNAK